MQKRYPLFIQIGIATERHATISGTVNAKPRRMEDLLQNNKKQFWYMIKTQNQMCNVTLCSLLI